MGQIGVHLHHRVITCGQRPGKAGQIGAAQTFLAGAVQHMDAACAPGQRGKRVGDLARAVG